MKRILFLLCVIALCSCSKEQPTTNVLALKGAVPQVQIQIQAVCTDGTNYSSILVK
jgi:hypothetical protein